MKRKTNKKIFQQFLNTDLDLGFGSVQGQVAVSVIEKKPYESEEITNDISASLIISGCNKMVELDWYVREEEDREEAIEKAKKLKTVINDFCDCLINQITTAKL
jgi:hypothetical protein